MNHPNLVYPNAANLDKWDAIQLALSGASDEFVAGPNLWRELKSRADEVGVRIDGLTYSQAYQRVDDAARYFDEASYV